MGRANNMSKYNVGDTAYILESNRIVRKVTIGRCTAGMYLIRFENGGGIQVKEHRLFETEEAALDAIPKKDDKPKRSRTPYDYM